MLSAVRRVALTSGAKIIAPTRIATCSMNTMGTFDSKERGDEASYIREMEATRAAEMRAKMEKILELDDEHSDKKELVGLLDGEKVAVTNWDRLQKWNYFVPLGVLVGVPALVNEFAVIDMETQILGAFLFTVGAVYNEFGNAIGGALDSERDDVKKAMNVVDDSLLQNVHDAVATNTNLLELETEVKDIHALTDDMASVQADYLNLHEEHKYRDAVARKLDALVALEDTASHAIRNRMMTKINADVVSAFTTDSKVKDAALAQAMSVLSSSNHKGGAKMSKDVVGEVYAKALKGYTDAYAKQPAGSDEIVSQMEKDIASIMQAPAPSHSGGNVYDLRTAKA